MKRTVSLFLLSILALISSPALADRKAETESILVPVSSLKTEPFEGFL